MLDICSIIILICASIVAIMGLVRRDIFDRILLLNTSTSIASLFICFIGSYRVNSSYIDIALIYFILSSVATIAYMKYFLITKSSAKKTD